MMKSVINFRDIALDAEQIVKSGMIFRSGHLDKVTNKNAQFTALGIKTIIDLRGPEEKKRKTKKLHGIRRHNIPMHFDSAIRPDIKAVILKKNARVKMKDIFLKKYAGLAEECKNEVKEIFDILSEENNYPLVFHCRAGKDRTGFISALIQKLLGVNYDHIIHDYLLSNNFFRKNMKKYFRVMKIVSLGLLNTSNFDFIVTTRKEYLEATFKAIEDQYKNISEYLISCGISRSQQQKVIAIMSVQKLTKL